MEHSQISSKFLIDFQRINTHTWEKEKLDHPKLGTHEIPSLVKAGVHLFCLHENGILVFDPDTFKVLQKITARVPRERFLIAGGGERVYYGKGSSYDSLSPKAPLQVHLLPKQSS
jgi:hypothetical protein